MRDKDKTREQLIHELAEARQRIAELEILETEHRRVERALRESLQASADIVQAIPAGLFTYQYEPPDRLILLDGNPEAERLTGITIEEWRGKEFNEIWPQAREAGVTEAFLNVIETGEIFEAEDLHYADEQLEGAFRIRAFRMPTERLGVAFENITGHKWTEEALRRQALIFENLHDAIIVSDLEGLVTDWNPAATRMYGYSKEEMLGRTADILNKPEESISMTTRIIDGIMCDGLWSGEIPFIRKDGAEGISETVVLPLFGEQGSSVALVGVNRDITERKRAEQKIKERQRYLEGVLAAAPDAIVTLNAEHRVVEWNPGAEKLFGYSAEEAIGRDLDDLITGPEILEEALGFTQMALDRKLVGPVEIVRYRKDGSPVDVILAGSPILIGSELIGTVAVYTDITERKRAERALRESHRRFLTVLDSIGAHIYTADMDTYEILFMNKPMRDDFGGNLVGKICWEVFRGESGPCAHCTNDKLLDADGNPAGVCIWEAHNPVTGRWYINYDRAIKWVDGRFVRLQIATDITERKRMEETLRQRNHELTKLHEATTVIISDLSLDVVLQAVVEQMAQALGSGGCAIDLWDRERDLVETLVDYSATSPDKTDLPGTIYHLSDYPATRHVLETGQPMVIQHDDPMADEAELALMEKQGVYTLLMLPLIARDRVWGLAELFNDVATRDYTPEQIRLAQSLTAQAAIAIENAQLHREVLDYAEQLEQRVQERTAELYAQYARLDAILRSTADGVVVTDEEGDIIQTNPVAQRWLARTLSPQEADRLREAVRNVATRTEERSVELLELTGLDLELSAGAISAPEPIPTPVIEGGLQQTWGEPKAVVALHDVSHLKALDRMKIRFITNISHELRTPITTIKLYAHLMQRQPEKWQQYLEPLAREADHQASLVEDILEIARIDAGRVEIEPRPTSLNELAEALVASRQALVREQGIALEYHPAEPGPVMLADPQRAMQALNNLMENAIRYTPEGGKVIVSTGTQEAQGRMWATVRMSDTGMGIPEDELPHIFDRFFRGEQPRAMQLTGTGLGLSIVKEIVELHGGQVAVESKRGVGSTFTIRLPLADAEM